MVDLKDFFLAAEFSSACPRDLDRWVERAKVRAKRLSEALELIGHLRTSWRWQNDPGKFGPYVFFVRGYFLDPEDRQGQNIGWCDAFFARELVSDLAVAERGVTDWRDQDKHCPVPLGDLSEARREPCTECDNDAYVIGTHWQTCDSPYGDTWKLDLQRFCPKCGLLKRIEICFDSYRLTSRIKLPTK